MYIGILLCIIYQRVLMVLSLSFTGLFVGFKEAGVFGDSKGAVRFDFLFDMPPEFRDLRSGLTVWTWVSSRLGAFLRFFDRQDNVLVVQKLFSPAPRTIMDGLDDFQAVF